jgi:hypothetical protein
MTGAATYLWLAIADHELPDGAIARVSAIPLDGGVPLHLAAWLLADRPKGLRVAKVAAGFVDPAGPAALVSLVLVPRGVRVPFDDQAVIGARRASLTYWPWRALSTLVRGDSEFAGAVSAVGPREPMPQDPFALLAPARRLELPAGFVGEMGPPAGPVLERYGSAKPWPLDRF